MKIDPITETAIAYGKLLEATRNLIQILNDNDEDLGDLPQFYEKTQKKAQKIVEQIDNLLKE